MIDEVAAARCQGMGIKLYSHLSDFAGYLRHIFISFSFGYVFTSSFFRFWHEKKMSIGKAGVIVLRLILEFPLLSQFMNKYEKLQFIL